MTKAEFESRHIGISEADLDKMLAEIDVSSMDELIAQTIPSSIRLNRELNIPEALTEQQYLKELRQ